MSIDAIKAFLVRHARVLVPDPGLTTPADWEENYKNGYDLGVLFECSRFFVTSGLAARYAANGGILDIGCGDGLFAHHVRMLTDAELVGVDCSATAVQLATARQLKNAEFVTCDMKDYRPSRLFDVVLLNESLYYVSEPEEFIARIASWLHPKGVLIISMYDTASTRPRWKALSALPFLHGVDLCDEGTGSHWRVRMFAKPS